MEPKMPSEGEFCYRCQKVQPCKRQDHAGYAEYLCAVCGWQVDCDFYDDADGDDERNCHYCGGKGWGIVGCDWDSDDPINGPYPGEVQKCPCCHGSGRSEDCTFW